MPGIVQRRFSQRGNGNASDTSEGDQKDSVPSEISNELWMYANDQEVDNNEEDNAENDAKSYAEPLPI